jgi:trehalose synthase
MLQRVDIGTRAIDDYAPQAGEPAVAELTRLAAPLAGARVLHLNATPYGGGVSELLRSVVPIERSLGLVADWKIISGDQAFFGVTKLLHNGLQGASVVLDDAAREHYLTTSRENALQLEEEYDVVVVHDPQPAALLSLHGRGRARWIWRCHIDTGTPHPAAWAFLRPFLAGYDAAVFTMPEFVPADMPIARCAIIPPAIDPLSPKNLPIDEAMVDAVLGWIGVGTDGPLVTQVSRFDPWKDPLGVLAAYRLARQEIPSLRLALVGSMALDDPQGWDVYRQIEAEGRVDPSVHVFTNLTGVGNLEVNAFQRRSAVIIQKSVREGFGLVVSEALWKGTPVVAGRAGGIPLQMSGTGGFLVDSVPECAARLVELVRDRDLARTLGEGGREHVRRHFLLPRLVADELRLFSAVLGTQALAVREWERDATLGTRDLVCGMPLPAANDHPKAAYQGKTYAFCCEECRRRFLAEPELYTRAEVRT